MKWISSEKIFSWLMILLVFVLPWQTIYIFQETFLWGSKWQAATIGFYATELLFWFTFGTFFFWYVKKKRIFDASLKINFSWTPDRKFLFSVLLFLLYVLASVWWSSEASLASQQGLRLLEGCLLCVLFLAGPHHSFFTSLSFVSAALIQSILALFQFFTQSTGAFKWLGLVAHPVSEPGTSVVVGEHIGRVLRAYGAFSHPNILGGYLVAGLFISFLLLQRQRVSKAFQFFLWGAVFFQLFALVVTFSRSAWIGATILVCFFAATWIRKRQWKILQKLLFVCVLMLPLLFFVFPILSNRVQMDSSHEVFSTTERISGIQTAWSLFQKDPFFGVGVGNFTVSLQQQNLTLEGWENQPVHNVPLLMLTELGVFGMGLWFFCLWTFFGFIHSLYTFRSTKHFFYLKTLFLILFFMSLFDHYWYSSWSGILLAASLIGLTFQQEMFVKEKKFSV